MPRLFLDFPFEVRLMIYKTLLLKSCPVDPITLWPLLEKRTVYATSGCFVGCTSIMATCRQIYEETRLVLYGKNSFFHMARNGAILWMKCIGEENMKLVEMRNREYRPELPRPIDDSLFQELFCR